mmetsp:Transcript_6636/g.14476  ORF Transcript_6636/g.14476 Transcript_6636/m.14476 type:complete len:248 (-) Transcript_6636:26-769(-)
MMGSASLPSPIPFRTGTLSGSSMTPLRMITATPEYPFFAVEHVQWIVTYSLGITSLSCASTPSTSSSLSLCSLMQKMSGFSFTSKSRSAFCRSSLASRARKLATFTVSSLNSLPPDASASSSRGVFDLTNGAFLLKDRSAAVCGLLGAGWGALSPAFAAAAVLLASAFGLLFAFASAVLAWPFGGVSAAAEAAATAAAAFALTERAAGFALLAFGVSSGSFVARARLGGIAQPRETPSFSCPEGAVS